MFVTFPEQIANATDTELLVIYDQATDCAAATDDWGAVVLIEAELQSRKLEF